MIRSFRGSVQLEHLDLNHQDKHYQDGTKGPVVSGEPLSTSVDELAQSAHWHLARRKLARDK